MGDRIPVSYTHLKPFGGINVVAKACKENGLEVDDKVKDIFTHYRKTHNDGVFDVYTCLLYTSLVYSSETNCFHLSPQVQRSYVRYVQVHIGFGSPSAAFIKVGQPHFIYPYSSLFCGVGVVSYTYENCTYIR